MARLKPGQYGKGGFLKKNPKYQSEARIKKNTAKLGLSYKKRSRSYKRPKSSVMKVGSKEYKAFKLKQANQKKTTTFADPNNPTAPTVENAAKLNSGSSSKKKGVLDIVFGKGTNKKFEDFINKFNVDVPKDTKIGIVPGVGLGKGAGAVKAIKKAKKLYRTGMIDKATGYFSRSEEFGLKNVGKHKIDLDFMLRLGDYMAPVGSVQKAGTIASNTKNVATFGNILKKHLSKNAMKYVMSSWIGSVIIGQWGRAESPEPFSFGENIVYDEALKSGDWSTYDEFRSAMDEIANVSLLEEIGLWTPASAMIGIRMKVKGWLAAQKARNAARDSERARVESGVSEADMWSEARAKRIADEKAFKLWEIEQNKIYAEGRREAERLADIKNLELWDEFDRKKAARNKKIREEQADFWLEYNKELLRIRSSNAPSQLNFGLL